MKKITKNKKIYSRPVLEVIEVDHEISFIMMTEPGGDPPPFGAAQISPSSQSSSVEPVAPSLENDPFGGSSPDYSN